MVNIMRTKRRAAGGAAGAPATLRSTELAFNEQDLIMYLGFGDDGSGNATSIITVGGSGSFTTLGTAQSITGLKTFTVSPLVPNVSANDNSTKAANTAYVDAAASSSVATAINAAAAKTTPVDADRFALTDSAASFVLKQVTWVNIKATLKTYFDTVYEAIGVAASAVAAHAALTSTHGVTGNIVGTGGTQTLTGKTLTSPVINTPTGIVKGDVGLGNVDNTSDAGKPVSTAQQTALDLKANLAGPTTFTGVISVPNQTANDNSAKVANTAYVDSAVAAIASGLDVKASVRAATTGPITISTGLNAGDLIDGVTLATNDRVLVKDQAAGAENGIYVVGAVPVRSADADTSAEVTTGMYTFIEEGTANGDSGWLLTTNMPIVLATTALVFAQFSGAGQITAGAGLTKTGNTLDVIGTANRITVAADSVDISTAYAGQATITIVGTIATGVWQGTIIAGTFGGLGVSLSTLTDGRLIKRSGTVAATAVLHTDYLDNTSEIVGGTF